MTVPLTHVLMVEHVWIRLVTINVSVWLGSLAKTVRQTSTSASPILVKMEQSAKIMSTLIPAPASVDFLAEIVRRMTMIVQLHHVSMVASVWMVSMTTPAAADKASLVNTVNPMSICVTGDLVRMEPHVKIRMMTTCATVQLASLATTVTRWWTGAPAVTHVRMVLPALRVDHHSTVPVPLAGLARCVMSGRYHVRLLPTMLAPQCLASARMEELATTLVCLTLVTVSMDIMDLTVNMNLTPASLNLVTMEEAAAT